MNDMLDSINRECLPPEKRPYKDHFLAPLVISSVRRACDKNSPVIVVKKSASTSKYRLAILENLGGAISNVIVPG